MIKDSAIAGTVRDWHLLGGLGTCTATERVARLLLADATGLTPVHVCRTLRGMRTDGLLVFTKGHLRVMDWGRLIEIAGMSGAGTPQPLSASRTGTPQRPLPHLGKPTAQDAFVTH